MAATTSAAVREAIAFILRALQLSAFSGCTPPPALLSTGTCYGLKTDDFEALARRDPARAARLCGAAARQTPPSLSVSLSLPSIYPGDVVRADLRGASEADRPTGAVFGRDLAFAFDPAAGVWRALIGIDLDTKPGAYPIAVKRR